MAEKTETKRLELPHKYNYLFVMDEGNGQASTIQDVCTDGIQYDESDFPGLDEDNPDTYPDDVQLVPLYAREHGVAFEVLREHGSGGGWPEVQFTGTVNAILHLLEHHVDEPTLSADYAAWVSAGKPKG